MKLELTPSLKSKPLSMKDLKPGDFGQVLATGELFHVTYGQSGVGNPFMAASLKDDTYWSFLPDCPVRLLEPGEILIVTK